MYEETGSLKTEGLEKIKKEEYMFVLSLVVCHYTTFKCHENE